MKTLDLPASGNLTEVRLPLEEPSSEERVREALERIKREQNLELAVSAGTVATLLGAAAWAGFTVATGYQIGFMAVLVGFLVGAAVRHFGNGVELRFGILGAGLSLVGCVLGNLLAVSAMISVAEEVSYFRVLANLDIGIVGQLMVASFHPMDLVFYGIAVYTGFRLSFREVTAQDLGVGVLGEDWRLVDET